MPVCSRCGTQLKDEAHFCFNCGAIVPSTSQTPPLQEPKSSTPPSPFAPPSAPVPPGYPPPYSPPSTPVPPGYPPPYSPPSTPVPPGYPPPYSPPSTPVPPDYSPPFSYSGQPDLTSDPPHWLVTSGSVVAIVSSFLPWYHITSSASYPGIFQYSYSTSGNAWGYWPGIMAIISSILILALAGARILKMGLPPLRDTLLYYSLAIIMIIGALIFWISPQDAIKQAQQSLNLLGIDVTIGPGIGLFLCLVAAVAIMFGNYLGTRERSQHN